VLRNCGTQRKQQPPDGPSHLRTILPAAAGAICALMFNKNLQHARHSYQLSAIRGTWVAICRTRTCGKTGWREKDVTGKSSSMHACPFALCFSSQCPFHQPSARLRMQLADVTGEPPM